MSDELKPCPFCGSESAPHVTDCIETMVCHNIAECDDETLFWVTCSVLRGGCGAEAGYVRTKSEAVAAWNARAERECHAVLKSELCYLPDDPPEVDEFHECSECGEVFPYGPEGYCPSCGAKVADVGIMRLVTLYDEDGAEGIECSECGWSEIHGWDDPMPDHCPMCKRKVVAE